MDANHIRLALGGVALIVSVLLIFLAYRKRSSKRHPSLTLFGASLALYAIAYNLYFWKIPPNEYIWLSLTVLGATSLPAGLFIFSLEYTQYKHWISWRSHALFLLLAAIFQFMLWGAYSDIWHQEKFAVEDLGFWIIILFSNLLLFMVFLITLRRLRRQKTQYRQQYRLVFSSISIPLVMSIFSLSGLFQLYNSDLMLIAYTLTGAVLVLGIFNNLLDTYPIERELAVESMIDGWMVLDLNDKVIDVNPSVEKTLGFTRAKIINQPAKKVLKNWENLVRNISAEEFEFSGSVKQEGDWRYFDIRLSKLRNYSGDPIGNLIVWQDVTERKKAREARQQARDEMYILLQSIMSASSRMFDMEDFLLEAIYQISYAFQSQHSVILLVDENEKDENNQKLEVVAQYGLKSDCDEVLHNALETLNLKDLFRENDGPLLVDDLEQDSRFAAIEMNESTPLCLLLAPLVLEGRLIGALALSRESENIFTIDEIARVNVIVDELASFIQSNRKRQITIAADERKRLVRDLHDSISQNLYGLLRLAEVAQTAVESGAPLASIQYLPRIGESARQALREMRLFLYQLQPIDLEHEGLAAVLQHRLSAVEGRSDIKARLLSDEVISLSPQKELALYYIAQEALNNVLKHAKAKSVNIHLKQEKSDVSLEVIDDGIGFDTKNIDAGGLGLRNMRERTALADGTIQIDSMPGKGTRIVVTVHDDRKNPRSKERQYL